MPLDLDLVFININNQLVDKFKLKGSVPFYSAKKLVKKWHGLQKENILKAWEHIQNDEVFEKVPPLT